MLKIFAVWFVAIALFGFAAACSSSGEDTSVSPTNSPEAILEAGVAVATADKDSDSSSSEASRSFTVSVWADNWFSLWVNDQLVGEDSIPITTERSFNAETFVYEATYPLTLAIEARDFKETDSGIEYIGQPNQQMGDGGLIAQVTDNLTGEVIVITNASWKVLVIHRAPLNTDCEKDSDPDASCEFEKAEPPAGWTAVDFDDGDWAAATEWTVAEVSPKDGYDEISWDPAAVLIWGSDLEVDNTILLRLTIAE